MIFKNISISELGTTITGKTPSSSYPEDFGNEYMFITPSDDFNSKFIFETQRYLSEKGIQKLKSKILPPKSILVSCIGSAMGKVIMNESTAITNQQINAIVPNTQKFNNDYVYYFLTNNYKLLRNAASGSTALPLLNKTDFDSLRIKVYDDVLTQQKIAEVLSVLDYKIALNNKTNLKLEQMAKTLFDYWFLQCDFPNKEGEPYKSSGGKMVFNETLKREIPKDWDVKKFNNLLSFTRGISYTSSTMNDQFGIPMINLKSFNLNGTYRTDGLKYFTGKINTSKIINKDDLLIAITDVTREAEIIGRAILAPKFGVDALCSCDVARVDIINESFSKNYLRYLFNSQHYHDYIKHFASGTLVLHLDLNGILWYTDIIPPKDLQIKFEDFVDSIDNKIQSNIRQSQELGKLRDWLLPMLMNGQVKVADAKEIINAKLEIVDQSPVNTQLKLTDKDKKIRRKMLATYIINQSLKDTSFGKTKFEKLLHLIECHIVKGDYNQKYSVQAAGPYDGGFTKLFWDEVTKAKWFKIEEFGKLRRIMPAENHTKSLVDYGYLSNDLKLMINDFIEEFKNTNYERPEIVSTLYAVWNNRIIRNEMITDELLKKDFLEWDAQKAKYKDRLDNALEWMGEKGIIPDGWGSEIRRAKKSI